MGCICYLRSENEARESLASISLQNRLLLGTLFGLVRCCNNQKRAHLNSYCRGSVLKSPIYRSSLFCRPTMSRNWIYHDSKRRRETILLPQHTSMHDQRLFRRDHLDRSLASAVVSSMRFNSNLDAIKSSDVCIDAVITVVRGKNSRPAWSRCWLR